MKIIFKRLLLLILPLLFIQGKINANNVTQHDYAILVKDERSVISATITGEDLMREASTKSFVIVIMGSVVDGVHQNQELLTLMKQGTEQGIEYVFCEIALERFGVKKSDLPNFLKTTFNAHIYMFELMKKGTFTLTI